MINALSNEYHNSEISLVVKTLLNSCLRDYIPPQLMIFQRYAYWIINSINVLFKGANSTAGEVSFSIKLIPCGIFI